MAFDTNNLVLAVEDDSSSYVRQPGWLYDFNFGYGCDVIEEDALNEKYCIQVLRILITKEDSEIDQLEKDLVSLQSELAWYEYEEWSDMCCNALRKNIDSLRTSLKSLKSNDIEVHLSIKPAESLHEIMKALLSDLFPEEIKQNEQLLGVVVMDSTDSPGQSTEDLEEKKKSCNSGSDVIVKGEMEECSIGPVGSGSVVKTSLTIEEDETNNSETVKLVSNFGQNLLELAAGHSHQKGIDYGDARKGEGKEHDFTPKEKRMAPDSDLSMKSADERRQNLELVGVQIDYEQPAEINLKNSSKNVLKDAVTYCKRKKPLNISDLKVIKAAKDQKSAADVLILDSSLNPTEKSTNISTEVKPANVIMQNMRAGAFRDATGQGGRSNNSDSKVGTSGQAKGGISNANSNGLRHPSGLIGRRNNSDPELATSRQVKVEHADGSPATLRHATGLNQSRNNCDSRLGGVTQENGKHCDINQKLCDFALKVARKRNIKEPNVTQADKRDSPSLEAEGSKKHSQMIVKVEKVDLSDTKNSTITSIVELQNGKGKDTAKKLPEEGTMKLELQLDAKNDKFNSDLSVKSQNHKSKRKTESSSPNIQQPVPFPAEVVSNAPSISKAKMQSKAGLGSDSSISKETAKKLPEEGTKQLQLQLAENFANNEKFNLDLSVKSQNQKAKRKTESSSPNIQQPVPFPAEVVSNAPSISKAKIQCKAGLGSDSSVSKETAEKLPEEGTMQLELQLVENFANNEKFNLDLSVKSQNQKAKRKTESSSPNIQVPVPLPAEVVSNAPSISKAKMQCKAGLGSDTSGSNQSWDRKTMKKKSRSSQYEGEENGSAVKDGQMLNLQPRKKRRKNSGLPIVVEIKGSTLKLDSSKSQSNPNDSTGKDALLITESYAIVPHSEAVPSATSILKDLKVGDLRAIAKENKLTNYYKLRKSDLIEQIAKHLRC